MNRIFFAVVFAIGLLTVGWVGWGFVGSSWLALVMTAVIAAVYLLGGFELRQFRADTASLAAALDDVAQPLPELRGWLAGLPPVLQNAVRLRIEGERVALPGPALTPYLVGLLVMLGMLGTFLGMVVTFKGAVFALEGSTDLQAIRTALAAPIKGLGLSFGTSVAGVAASAMLGLLSAISRRERLDVARLLDSRVATVFKAFSLTHQRQETFKALQLQAHALPEVAGKLQAMMDGLERRSQHLNEQLLGSQAQFHREVSVVYTGLADSVGLSLKDNLTAAARAASESIRPVVEAAMAEVAQESKRLHERVSDAAQSQLKGLTEQFGTTARTVSDTWTSALQTHALTSDQQVQGLDRALTAFTNTFEQRSAALLATVNDTAARSQTALAWADQQRLDGWTQSMQAMAATLHGEWQRAGAQTLAQQQAVCEMLEKTAGEITQRNSEQASRTIADMTQLLTQSEALVRARVESEAGWTTQHGERMDQLAGLWRTELGALRQEESARGHAAVERLGELQAALARQLATLGAALETPMTQLLTQSEALVRARVESEAGWVTQHGERMDQLASLWRTELGALRQDEAARGNAAVERLGELQAALAGHLATLGAALETPMTRLMQTASEVPQAAAEVIAQLRQEMTRLSERDNLALEERNGLVAQIRTLLQTINQASVEQRAAIESLVASSAAALDKAGEHFSDTLGSQTGKAEDMAAHVTGSAVELSSLGESFNHGVQLFNATNEKLIDTLQRMEATMGQSMARSDEQLAYYVAQAREVIDLSISSQQGIVEDLRLLHDKQAALAEGAAG